MFLDNLEVLATHPSEMVLEMVLVMKIPHKSRVRPLNPDPKENLWNQIDEWCNAPMRRTIVFIRLLYGLRFCQLLKYLFYFTA